MVETLEQVLAVRLDLMLSGSVIDGVGSEGLTVGAVASLVGVPVRTLHHWEAMELICPSERSLSGYRLYSAADVARIHRVLIYREFGLSLERIATLLNAPADDAEVPLQEQRAQLVERISRLQGMVAAVDRMIEEKNIGILLTAEEQVTVLGQHWQPSWPADARAQWGDTAQWAEYAERSASMTVEHWGQIAAVTSVISDDLATAKRAGIGAGSAEANALAERHRASISEYFHCTHSMHVCLGKMYVADDGYAAYYEAFEPDLAGWLQEIINANARDHGIDPETASWR